jgi:hypothetical protein
MTYEKLTYGGTDCNSYLYFSFDAGFFDTGRISAELNLEPTSISVKKDPVPKSTSWMYRIEVVNGVDLETSLDRILDVFESKIATINRLKQELQVDTWLQFVIYIDIEPDSSTPYFGLNRRAVEFLSQTNTRVDFDLYKSDTIGLLNKVKGK